MLVRRKMWINLTGGFASILIVMIVVAYVGYSGMSNVIQKYNQGNQVNHLSSIISTVRQHEKNFVIHQDKKYAEWLLNKITEFKKEATEARSIFKNLEYAKYLDTILLSTDTYKKAFDDYVARHDALIDTRAAMDTNAQALIEKAQSLEQKFETKLATVRVEKNAKVLDKLKKVEDANQIIEWTLACQLNEKQFIVSKKDQHADNINARIRDIIELAGDMKERFSQRSNKMLADSLIESAKIYQAGFKQYVMLPWKGSELDMLEGAKNLIVISRAIREKQHNEMRQVQLNANAYMENHLARAENMHEVVNSILLCLRDGRNFIRLGSNLYIAAVKGHVNKIIGLVEKTSAQIQDNQNREPMGHILELIRAYKNAFDKSVKLKGLQKESLGVLLAAARATDDVFNQIHTNQIILIERQIAFARNVLLTGSVLGFLFGVILAFLIIKQAIRASNLLRSAKEKAETASQAKSDFLASMSHEIRTPLNAVTGLTNIVLKTKLTTEQRDYLNKVQIASKNLLEVINDILDFSKVEAGHLDLNHAPFDLNQLLEQLSELFSNRLAQKNLELKLTVSAQIPRQLIGDAGRLSQVLTNLIANAIEFTSQGGIIIRVEPEDPPNQRHGQTTLKFQISDTGSGIAADMLPTVFDPFTQVDASLTREHQGTGLGLSICQRLVKLMNGKIWAQSTPGEGSTFYFTVRLKTPIEQPDKRQAMVPHRPQEPGALAIQRLAGRRVLVVEDSTLNRDVAVVLLEQTGLKVETAENGQEAVGKITESPMDHYDAILMDIQMPIMDGYQATRHIRKWETNAETADHRIPIIALTAHALKGEKEKCIAADMDDYLSKPIDEKELHRVLFKWIASNKEVVNTGNRSLSGESLPNQITLDVQGALKRLGGREQLYIKVIEQFVPECNTAHKTIAKHLSSGNRAAASRTAHTIKGVAATIGAGKLNQAAANLEKAIDKGGEDIDGLLHLFTSQLQLALEAANQILIGNQGTKT